MIALTSKWKPHQNSNMADVRFQKPEVVLSQPWIEISHQNLARKQSSIFLNRFSHYIYLNAGIDFRLYASAVLRRGRGGMHPKPEPCTSNIYLQQQYAVVKPANSYTGGVFWRVEVVDVVVLACDLRATTKKGVNFIVLSHKYFPLEPPLSVVCMLSRASYSAVTQ